MKESQIEKKIREYAESQGCLFKKFTSPGWTGAPDRIIILPRGYAVPVGFMEVKKPGGEIRPRQIRFYQEMNHRGVPSVIVDNVQSGILFINALLNAKRLP